MKYVMALAAFALAPTLALADVNAATACGAKLNKDAKLIFDSVIRTLPSETPLKDLVRNHTRDLALAGKIERASARDSAVAAGECLRLVNER